MTAELRKLASRYRFSKTLGRNFYSLKAFDHHLREASDEEVIQAIRSVPDHFVGMSSLVGSVSSQWKWTAQNNLTGAAYSPTTNGGQVVKTYNLGTANANNASGGSDEVFSFQQTISAGSSATVDLTQMTNLLQQAAVSIVRIKALQIRLLNATDDSTITTPVASSITVSNVGVATPSPLDFQSAGSGLTLTLTTAAGAITNVVIGAAGSGYPPSSCFLVNPVQTGSSGAVISVITNGSGVPTTVALVTGFVGTGYTNATVPTVQAGFYAIASGGSHQHFDVSAAGFLAVSSTQKQFKIYNNDASNVATFELSAFGATT